MYKNRPYPHVVVMVGLERFDDLWGYAVEPLMLDRPKMISDQAGPGVYAVRGWLRFASGTRLLIRRDCTREPGTA